jgi:cation transport regulator
MPYRRVEDLPRVQVAPYDDRQKEAFLEAFNLAWAENGGDESLAFASAHDAARRVGGNMAGLAAGLLANDAALEENLDSEETQMPYRSVQDLPQAQVDQYDEHQKEAFLKAFNNAFKEYGGDEHRAFAVAHHAAKQAGDRPGPG